MVSEIRFEDSVVILETDTALVILSGLNRRVEVYFIKKNLVFKLVKYFIFILKQA